MLYAATERIGDYDEEGEENDERGAMNDE